jgi:REP element-mobilizing transposase RayT
MECPGAIYHVMNRGDRREDIFKDDQDRERFLATLGEACAKTQWRVHAYCLMSNHFHWVIETPQPNLVAGMKWLLGTYTSRFNIHHKLCGHWFAGRYVCGRQRCSRPMEMLSLTGVCQQNHRELCGFCAV